MLSRWLLACLQPASPCCRFMLPRVISLHTPTTPQHTPPRLTPSQGSPLGGGQVSGQGRMWVAPEAENHPAAIAMQGEGAGMDTAALLSCYIPPEVVEQLPAGALASLGPLRARGTMAGSHLAPEVEVAAELPRDSRLLVSAAAGFSPAAMSLTARGPALSLDTTLHISMPHQALLRASDTQAEASHWARPRFEGIDVAGAVVGLDLLPLTRTATAPALDPVSSGQPLHARVSGAVRASLRPVNKQPQSATLGRQAVAAGGAVTCIAPPDHHVPHVASAAATEAVDATHGASPDSMHPAPLPPPPQRVSVLRGGQQGVKGHSGWPDLTTSHPSVMFTGETVTPACTELCRCSQAASTA